MADTAGKPNAGYTLTLGSATATSQRILSHVASVRRKEKGKIQMVIVTGSRERAFFLFASICRQARNVPLTCHASVGSLKFERDLKALHFGVDVLIVTSGRLTRLYQRNENCFDKIERVLLDQCELLFSRPVVKKVRRSVIHERGENW